MIHDHDELRKSILGIKSCFKKIPNAKFKFILPGPFPVEHPVTVARVWYIQEKLWFEFEVEFEDSWLPHVFPR